MLKINFFKFYYLVRGFKYRNLRLKFDKDLTKYFKGKCGLEVGGPSLFFDLIVPVYHTCDVIDGVNFSESNIWSARGNSTKYEYLRHKKGALYVSEMTDLSCILDSHYDFIISSNVLEHTANPLLALNVWRHKVKIGGVIFIVVPNKLYCFDRARAVTTIDHLISDFNNNRREDDLTHLPEVLEMTDRSSVSEELIDGLSFDDRMRKNYKYRSMHHHVFDKNLLINMCKYLSLEVLFAFEKKADIGIICKVKG